MYEIGEESQAKRARRERFESTMEEIRVQRILDSYGLSREESARTRTFTAGDPVSDYIGYPHVQAEMIVDERESKGRIRERFERVVQGIGNFLRIPMHQEGGS